MRPALPRLHAITDERIARRPDLDAVANALATGGGAGPDLAIHARGRSLTGREHHEFAVRLRASGNPVGSDRPAVSLFVNDRLDVALAVGAAGVQLGQGSLPASAARRINANWWIGRSVHSLDEARCALDEAADYLFVGPVYATATHPAVEPLGLARLGEIARLPCPVIAIGGVTPERVPEIRRAGAYGVAAIRALWSAADPAAAAREMLTAMDQA